MTRGFLAATLLAGTVYCVVQPALAQSDAGTIETVIVTGRKAAEPDKVPMKAAFTQSTISRETILNASPSPAGSIQTLLNSEPSIYAVTGGPNGVNTDIKFRSFSDGEFGETVAGVPLNDLFNGGVTFQADNRNNVLLITQDLDSVQLYRGVNNPDVNTYNSLGGTINYTPRQPSDDFGGNVGVDGGSFNTMDYHAQIDTGDVDGIKQTLSFERDFSSSWLQNNPDANQNLYYAGNAQLNGDTQVYAYAVYNQNKGDAPDDVPINLIREFGQDYQYARDEHYENNNDENFMGIIGIKSRLNSFITFQDSAYVSNNDYKRTAFTNPADAYNPYHLYNTPESYPFWLSYYTPGYDPVAKFGSTALGTDYQFYGYHGAMYGDNAQVAFDLPFNKVTAGGDFNVGELHSREYWYGSYFMPMKDDYNDAWDEHDTRQMWSAFIQDDIHFWDARIHITPGIKYISAVSKDNDAIGYFYVPPGSLSEDDRFWSPTVGASIEPLDNFTIYGSYGKNVKFPDITSLYGELGYGGAIPRPDVQPEYVQDYEFGARYKWESAQVELNVYQENFSNVIINTYPPDAYGAAVQQNGGNERYRGVEFQLTNDFGQVFVGNLEGYLNASYSEAVCTTNFSAGADSGGFETIGSCTVGESLSNIPNYLASAGLTWDHDGWHVDLQGHYVGVEHIQDYYSGLPTTTASVETGQPVKRPDYFLLSLGVVKVVPINVGPATAIRFGLHLDNLFNTRYFADAETDSDGNNPVIPGTSEKYLDTYAIPGEPRAVFGSISIYF